jgi:integrase
VVAQIKFTQESVEGATCPPDRKDVLLFDSEMSGFGLRVGSNGSKTFLAQYTTATGKRRVPLGVFGVLTVKDARKRAKSILGDAAGGRDPFAERKAAAEAQRAAETAARARAFEEAYSVRKLVKDWQTAREGDRRESYLTVASAALLRHFAEWLDRPASGVTTAEAVRALDRIKAEAGPTAANRALSYARAAYGWAVRRQALTANPFAGVEAPSRERSRDRVLAPDELGAIWRAADALTAPYDAFMRVLLLTLQRREEVAAMKWSELDDADEPTTWTLPAERAKNAKAHVIHLAEAVRTLIKQVKRRKDCDFVFPSDSGRPVSAFSAAKRRLDEKILEERQKADPEATALPGWTLHDFRRAGVTALAGMGFAPHVCDKLLNHVSGSIRGVAAVYQRAEFLPERKAALDAWATHVIASAERRARADNVVALRSTGATA